MYVSGDLEQCGGFLCCGKGECSLGVSPSEQHLPPSKIVLSLIYIMTMVGTQHDLAHVLIPALEKSSNTWGSCLDRRQVSDMLVTHLFVW
jgi:hypothetical protein